MPNDSAGSFPMPPANNQPEPETPSREIKLTDEVAPDLTTPPVESPVTPTPQPAPLTPVPVEEPVYQPPVAPMPATMPTNVAKPFPVVTLLLLLISIGAIAATYFFYQQTKSLNLQLDQITKTLQQQTIKENQATITPTTNSTPSSTTSAQVTPTPTSTSNSGTGPVWSIISDVMATAQKTYPGAQLILIKAESIGNSSQIIKFFFRQNTTDRKYFYLLKETGKDLALVDQNVTVFETSLLPSLNGNFTGNQLGLDLDAAITLAAAACPASFDCINTPVTGQYVKSGTTLWQITYKPNDSSQPFVVQIDAATKKIIYKSL